MARKRIALEIGSGVQVTVNDKPASGTVTLQTPDVPKPADRVDFGELPRRISYRSAGSAVRQFDGRAWFTADRRSTVPDRKSANQQQRTFRGAHEIVSLPPGFLNLTDIPDLPPQAPHSKRMSGGTLRLCSCESYEYLPPYEPYNP